ncbi:MAG: hypothetical protein IJK87_13530 [Prevotella sp.]|nr:hypothetical protein [Prevotella sp.]
MPSIERHSANYLAVSDIILNFASTNKYKSKFNIMARPIRETPVLKGEDAFNFEMRRLMVDNMSAEQRAENRRKLEEQVKKASEYIEICI